MRKEGVSPEVALARAQHQIPALFKHPNTILDRLRRSPSFVLESEMDCDVFGLTAGGLDGDALPFTTLRLFPYASKPEWSLQVDMWQVQGPKLTEGDLYMWYVGKVGEQSSSVGVGLYDLHTYFSFDFARGVIQIMPNDLAGNYPRPIAIRISDTIDNERLNKQLETAQTKNTGPVFHGFEIDQTTGLMGFKISGLNGDGSDRSIVIPSRVKVKLK